MKEIVVWAIPAGQADRLHEQPIQTFPGNRLASENIERVKKAASADGWHSFRIQVIDGSLPDFAGAVRRPDAE